MSTTNNSNNNLPNFFSIIPANIRYNKNLCSLSKLIYSEITALCNYKGYCYANNKYFAKVFDVTNRTIINCLNELKNNNYINILIINNNKRKIFLNYISNSEKHVEINFESFDWLNCDEEEE